VEAQENWNRLLDDLDITMLRFKHYGTAVIKGIKMSPDTLIQMAVQLAYYKVHRSFTATYETGHSRRFHHGRTETVRVCSKETKEWVLAMQNPEETSENKIQLLIQAMTAHKTYMVDTIMGKGCDRHLLGLRIVAMQEGLSPAIFADPAYAESSAFRVSTSNMQISNMTGGFGAVRHDGYGICYQLWREQLVFSIVSHKNCKATASALMSDGISQSLLDILALSKQSSKM